MYWLGMKSYEILYVASCGGFLSNLKTQQVKLSIKSYVCFNLVRATT